MNAKNTIVFTLLAIVPTVCYAGGFRMSDSQARGLLTSNGIPVVSSGNCITRSNPTCTSLDQIYSDTIYGIISFKKGSTCAITVTGGTEVGHSTSTYSHSNGYKVDISLTSCVNAFIPAYFSYFGIRGDGAPQYKNSKGDIYARESTHWDILYF